MSRSKRLVFASNNKNKLNEVSAIMGPGFPVSGLGSLGFEGDIPEPFDTLKDNALAKARFVYRNYKCDCFADDTGLEVEALGGLPGVRSARYAGTDQDSLANVRKLLGELEDREDRRAWFRTIIALILDGREYIFEGMVSGKITANQRGSSGFGYDPVFVPEGYSETFAEMDPEVKNQISHRRAALKKLAEFLKTQ